MPQKQQEPKPARPAQEQPEPGLEAKMTPKPKATRPAYKGSGKLQDRVALITGGDSGIGRSVAVHFAREGADVAIIHLAEEEIDAQETKRLVEAEGRRCLTMVGDIGDEGIARSLVDQTVKEFGRLDVLVNNAAEQHPQHSIEKISAEQLEHTFRTNVFGMFYMTKAALPHLKEGSTIINTTSVTAYRGSASLLDYSATKGAIVSFTRSLAHSLVEKGIRVNGVAPGPIWTPLIPSTFPGEKVAKFGTDVPMGRAGETEEVAPCYVFLAALDSSYLTGQILHPNGGEIVNG
jgi:NAD(P)-dependent dehydrogenase (short-subunit alcohol dehydrogenase family)